MVRKWFGLGAVALLAVAAYGCGSSGSDAVSTGSRDTHIGAAQQNADGSSATTQTVTYQGLAFDVPGDWPVYDLSKDPTTCVRFDRNAVYLGTPSSEMDCPAGIVGAADAVIVQPANDQNSEKTASVGAQDVNGLSVQTANDAATHEIDATTSGVSAMLTYGANDATVQRIVQSFRKAGQ